MHYIKTFAFLAPLLIVGFVLWRNLLDKKIRHWCELRYAIVVPLAGIGYFAPSIWLYYGAVVAAMILLPRSRIEAAAMFIIISLMLPLAPYDVRAGSVLLVRSSTVEVAAIGLLTSIRFPGDSVRIRTAWSFYDTAFLFMMLLVILLASRVIGTSITTAIRETLICTLTFILPYWLLGRAPIRGQDPRRLIHYVVMAGFILSIEAVFEVLRHWPLYQSIDSNLGLSDGRSKTLAVRGGLMRAPGPFYESTTFGVFLSIVTVIAASSRSLFRAPVAQSLVVAVCIAGTGATLARNAWLGLVVGIIMISLYRKHFSRAFALGMIGMVGLAGLSAMATGSNRLGEVLGVSGHAASTADYRENLLENSIPLIMKSPLIGTRYDDVRAYMRPQMRSRALSVDYVNSYLYFLVVSGVIGLVIFALYSFYPMLRILILRKAMTANIEYEIATALFAATGAFALMIAFTSYSERIPLFALFLIVLTRQLDVRLRSSIRQAVPKMPLVFSSVHNPVSNSLPARVEK